MFASMRRRRASPSSTNSIAAASLASISCETWAISRLAGISNVPRSTCNSPRTSASRLDLPLPLAPVMPTFSPRNSPKVASSNNTRAPRRMLTSVKFNMYLPAARPAGRPLPHQVVWNDEILVSVVLRNGRLRLHVRYHHLLLALADARADLGRDHGIVALVAHDRQRAAHELRPPLYIHRHAPHLPAVDEAVVIVGLQARQPVLFDQLLDLGQPRLALGLVLAPSIELLVASLLERLHLAPRGRGR